MAYPPLQGEGVEGTRSVAILVCTHKRPDGLRRLLAALDRIDRPRRLDVRVVVVDNDPDASARWVVEEFPDSPIEYHVEAEPGIPAARSRAISLGLASDYVAFIDDDEVPEMNWLVSLVSMCERYATDGVAGRVAYSFEKAPKEWVARGGFFDAPRIVSGDPICMAGTGNLLLRVSALQRLDVLRFDQSMRFSGGSDSDFTYRLTKKGADLRWCEDALVIEHVPAHRTETLWALKRAYRTGNISGHLVASQSRHNKWSIKAQLISAGLLRVAISLPVAIVAAAFKRPEALGNSVRRGMRGLGFLGSAFGRQYQEYASRHKNREI